MYQRHEKMSTVELQIAERARKFKGEALHNLHEYIDEALLQESYEKLNKRSAAGIDGKTWQAYGLEFPERRESLLGEFKSGRYRAPAIRRIYIPKDKHSQRPLGTCHYGRQGFASRVYEGSLNRSMRKILNLFHMVFDLVDHNTKRLNTCSRK